MDSSFFAAKDLGEIRTGSCTPYGSVKIADILQITRCKSKTVHDRRIVSIKVK